MGVGSGLYVYDVVVQRSCSLSHLLMSSCWDTRYSVESRQKNKNRQYAGENATPVISVGVGSKYVSPTETYAGRVACCPLVSHGEYVDGTDGRKDARPLH